MAIFASGGGSNFQALIDRATQPDRPFAVVLCVTNKATAGALARAQRHDIPACVLAPQAYPDEATYVADLLDALAVHQVNFIALAGYMRKIPSAVVAAFQGRMLNIHPALLPKFGGKGMYGKHVHRAVLAAGEAESGATVHVVDEQYDTGPIVLQARVPVKPDDTPDTLAARVLEAEHRIYPEALCLFAEGRVQVDGPHIHVAPA